MAPAGSSAGVYLEGLIDAYRLATDLGDDRRRSSYRTAILRGLRSLLQLQFRDESTLFYISKAIIGSVVGGDRAGPALTTRIVGRWDRVSHFNGQGNS